MRTGVLKAAQRYFEAYDRYQTLFARLRLQGWEPPADPRDAPPEMLAAYSEMIGAHRALYREVYGEDPPNYVELACAELNDDGERAADDPEESG